VSPTFPIIASENTACGSSAVTTSLALFAGTALFYVVGSSLFGRD
jgi:hypothetical protein